MIRHISELIIEIARLIAKYYLYSMCYFIQSYYFYNTLVYPNNYINSKFRHFIYHLIKNIGIKLSSIGTKPKKWW